MPRLTTLLAFALGYPPGGREVRGGARWQQPDATLAYGEHPLQQLDFYSAGAGQRPLLAFLHGGAWQFGDKARRLADAKAPFARRQGWHFASLNFRLVPEVGVAEMARDAAAGIARLLAEAGPLGIDPRRVVLMGHSSGAQLAALVGTDPRYLAEAGRGVEALAGVIANDGAGYDPRERSVRAEWLHRRLIAPAFPSETQAELSAAVHALSAPNAGAFLILHAGRDLGSRHAQLLEAALRRAGTPVERHGFAGRGPHAHVMLSRKFGTAGFPATDVTLRWLRARFEV
ncbi:MAG TPA: alpha/beta hydrolase [Croceibacterium sp.]